MEITVDGLGRDGRPVDPLELRAHPRRPRDELRVRRERDGHIEGRDGIGPPSADVLAAGGASRLVDDRRRRRERAMQTGDELAHLATDRRVARVGALEAPLPSVAGAGQKHVALGQRQLDPRRRTPGEGAERCGNPLEPDLREVAQQQRSPRRPRADVAEPLDDGPLPDDDGVMRLVDADRALRRHRDAGDERRNSVAGRARRHDPASRTTASVANDPPGWAASATPSRSVRRTAPTGSRAPGSTRVKPSASGASPAGGHEPRNSSSSPASVPYDWTSIPVTPTRTMMAQPLTVLFMPESAYGPTNNCIGIGDILRQARPPGRLRGGGVVEGPARAARLRRGPRRPRPAARRPTPPSRTPASSGRTSSGTRRRSSASRRSSSSRRSCSRRGRR